MVSSTRLGSFGCLLMLLSACGGGSNPAPTPPTVLTNPVSLTVVAGASTSFTAAASGTPAPTVQWQTSTDSGSTFTDVAGATAPTLTFTAASSQNANQFRAVFTNSSGTATTIAAVLTVTGTAPVITGNPSNQTAANGANVSFTASASGTPAPLAQWQQSSNSGLTFSNVAGATASTYTFAPTLAQNGFQYRVVFTNGSGSATSTVATLTVTNPAPVITSQPSNQTVIDGASVTFTAAASGSPSPSVQWQQSSDGGATFTNVSGATGASLAFTAAIAQSGYLYRAVFTNAFGTATTTAAKLTVSSSPVASVPLAVGNSSVCAIKPDRTVLCWGNNAYGELGIGSSTPGSSTTPLSVVGITGAAQIIAAGDTYCVVKTDTTVVCWGSGSGGELGNGSVIPQDYTPGAPVSGLNGVVQVGAGFHHFCAVKSDTTLACWGQNGYGQYGDGTTNPSLTPIIVPSLSGVIDAAGGSEFTCATINDGTARCWGFNTYGNLGDGTTTQRLTPVTVSGLSTAQAVSAGGAQSCALMTGGAVRCWGNNTNGQAGIGTYSPDHFTVPQAVVALGQAATAITAQGDSVCALLADATVSCWGINTSGQLGNGTTLDSDVPVAVSGLTGVKALSKFGSQVCALKTDHTIWCWGSNSYGQLGNGTTTDSPTPVQVSGGAIFD